MNTLPDLLAVAAGLLERVGELSPITITCDQATRVLPQVTVTPASLSMTPGDQTGLVRAVADGMGWSVWPLDGGRGAVASGAVAGVEVQVLAAPLAGRAETETVTRRAEHTTAEHAGLLRALIDWSATLPAGATALEVREDIDDTGAFTARLVMASHQAADTLTDVVLPVADDGWSGHRGLGILPTGHALSITVDT